MTGPPEAAGSKAGAFARGGDDGGTSPPTAPVSVVVPVRNCERYLGEALNSILDQRPRPAEIIVVDDGSTDGTVAVAESFGDAVTLLRQPASGIATAVNRGVRAAGEPFLGSLDADDLWPPGSLAARLELLEARPELDAAVGLVDHFVSPELGPERRAKLKVPPSRHRGLLRSAALIRAEVWPRVGEMDEGLRVAEFVDWWARAEDACVTSAHVDVTVLRRRLHDDNIGIREVDRRVGYAQVIRVALERRRKAGVDEAERSRP